MWNVRICFFSFLVGFVAICAVFPTCRVSAGQNVVTDPISELLQEYRKLSLSGASEAERVAMYEEWRRFLTVAVRDNPESESKRIALNEIVRICNAMGDQDQALRLLEELMDDEEISLWERYDLQAQHAGISRMKLLLSPSPTEEEGAEVVESFSKLNDLINRLLIDMSGAPVLTMATADGGVHKVSPFDRLSEQKIIKWGMRFAPSLFPRKTVKHL